VCAHCFRADICKMYLHKSTALSRCRVTILAVPMPSRD
jgi:hypothetical protein